MNSSIDVQRLNLWGAERPALEDAFEALDAARFHGRQAYRWMYRRRVLDPGSWTDLSRDLRERFAAAYRVEAPSLAPHLSAGDGTVKHRVGLRDGAAVETVYMVHGDRITLCVSSQAGCALGCEFCLTGRMGLTRHLDAGEIVGQVSGLRAAHDLDDRPFNIVFMGMGEPLHNYDAVLASVRVLCDPDGFGMSRRRLTVSTVGLVPAIERLATEAVRPRLAVSLNATTDEIRDRVMPVNRRYPLATLLDACGQYLARTGDRFTFEYVLLGGVNDSDEDVARLSAIVRRHRAKLNLIPFNSVDGWLAFEPPPDDRVDAIRDRLLDAGIAVSVRWSRGRDARAACGQLALLPDDTQEGPRS